jgi:hypothetical protein
LAERPGKALVSGTDGNLEELLRGVTISPEKKPDGRTIIYFDWPGDERGIVADPAPPSEPPQEPWSPETRAADV